MIVTKTMHSKKKSLSTTNRIHLACAVTWCVAMGTVHAAPGTITTLRLLDDMTNLAAMAEFPDPAYTCKQFSSYDPASKSPAQNWFANGDAGHYLRVEDRAGHKEYVMMDAAGPGALVRLWSANPAGTLRIYLDDADKPVIEAPMTEVLGGRYSGWPRPIAGEYSKGWNLYFPIPYARRCKVTSDQGKFYYHVNYRTYPAGTLVETFQPAHLSTLQPQIAAVAKRMEQSQETKPAPGDTVLPLDISLAPGATERAELQGPAAITWALVRCAAKDREAALRGVIVRATFDGEKAIETPLGDFFGSAPGVNPYSSLPLGMQKSGEMYCQWLMPFKTAAVIELSNQTRELVSLTGELATRPYEWTDNSMHFHAKWRADFDVPTRPMQDWNYLTAQGKGVFAGVAFAIDNPVKEWWGEGDEKIYVDSEKFPSHFGTGTEDYYGYAWCFPGLFTHAYHSQPRCDGPGNYGRTSVNRFHLLDRIPFTRDFKFDMELWHWNATCKVNMAVVAYWYARPGASDTTPAIRAEQAVVRPIPPYVAPRVAGAIEGETMHIMRVIGTAESQDWNGLSGEQHLWWHAGMKPGDSMTLTFPAPEAGKYRVYARFLRARDYGIHQLAINGARAGEPLDAYNPQVAPSKETDLGVHELKAGNNEFTVTVIGANPKAIKSYMFGLDYLRLKAAE